MAHDRFGPNTEEVEGFLERLRDLDRARWRAIQKIAPEAGALPEHELSAAPKYFAALAAAAQVAKSGVFPGSESAFFEAMRVAHHRAVTAVAGLGGVTRLRPSAAMARVGSDDPEAILALMAEEFENETWGRAVSACMVAAGALVMRSYLDAASIAALFSPVEIIGFSSPGAGTSSSFR